MIDILELVIFSIGLFLLAYLSVMVLRLRRKTIKLTEKLVQNNIDRNTLFEKLAELKAEQDAKGVAETEGFLKFLSESRQMAFEYIENVQIVILDHIKAVESKDWDLIENSIKRIKDLLPKNEEK